MPGKLYLVGVNEVPKRDNKTPIEGKKAPERDNAAPGTQKNKKRIEKS